jgi:hypothetical protein
MPGYKGILYYGTAGSMATNQVLNAEDLNYDVAVEKVKVGVRGDSSGPIIDYEEPVARMPTITFSMIRKGTDSIRTALVAAARVGDVAVALRLIDITGGIGFDGDVTLQVTNEMTLKGQHKYNFTATPTDRNRAATLNS